MTDAELDALREDVAQIKRTLYIGNGKPPLVSRVDTAEVRAEELRTQLAEIKRAGAWLIKLGVGNIVAALGAYLPKLIALAQGMGAGH